MQEIDCVQRNDLKRVELLSVSIKHALPVLRDLPGRLQTKQSNGGLEEVGLHVSSEIYLQASIGLHQAGRSEDADRLLDLSDKLPE